MTEVTSSITTTGSNTTNTTTTTINNNNHFVSRRRHYTTRRTLSSIFAVVILLTILSVLSLLKDNKLRLDVRTNSSLSKSSSSSSPSSSSLSSKKTKEDDEEEEDLQQQQQQQQQYIIHHDDDRFEKNRLWESETRDKLCPNGLLPNLTYSNILFDLARYELLNITQQQQQKEEEKEEYNNNNNSNSSQNLLLLHKKFFNGFYRWAKWDKPLQGIKLSTNSYLAYVRIWKGGNNQIRYWQQEKLPQLLIKKKTSSKTEPPVDVVDNNTNNNPKLIIQNKTSLCIVTAIRDPVDHFLSGYNHIESEPGYSTYNVSYTDLNIPYLNLTLGSLERFESFVFHLVKEHSEMVLDPRFLHVYPMSRILSPLNDMGLKLTGYLPSITNLSMEWPQFLYKTCPNVPIELSSSSHNNTTTKTIIMEKMGQHKSSKDPKGTYKAAKDVWSQNGPTSRALCILHAMDYACYRNLPDGIPDLCRNVYNSDVFINSI